MTERTSCVMSESQAQTKLHILVLTPLPPPEHGGIVNWTRIIRRELRNWPDITLSFIDSAVRYRSPTNLSPLLRLAGGSAQAIRDILRTWCRICLQRPDLLHLCTSGGPATLKDLAILWMARLFRIPALLHYHMGRLPSLIARNGVEWRLTRTAMRLASMVIVLDQHSAEQSRAAAPEVPLITLPNMIELDVVDAIVQQVAAGAPEPAHPPRILFLGQLLPAKGIRELVTACARVVQDHPLELHLVGPVEQAFVAEIHRLAQANGADGLPSWLVLHGAVSHAAALRHLAGADIFVLPSYSEGAPTVVLEAMACGKPIIATSVGAIPEMLAAASHEVCGICIPARDVDALVEAIRCYLHDADRARHHAHAARLRAEMFYTTPVACAQLVKCWYTTCAYAENVQHRSQIQ